MEKEKRLLVVILAFLLLRLWFVVPYVSILDTGQTEYVALSRAVAKAQILLDRADNQEQYLQSVRAVARENSSFLMSGDSTSRGALARMQKKLSDFLEEMNFEVSSVTWGEPYVQKGTDYVRLPLSFVATTNSDGLHKFLEIIGRRKPLLLFDSLSITSQRKELRVKGQLIGFSRVPESKPEGDPGQEVP